MFKSKLSKVIVSLLRRVLGVTRSGAKRLMRAMLRSLMAMGRRARLPVAGFVLPTVTMVLLVVILLTVAITLRSFDRANLARNVRVNQQVLAAATPALDRAKAKIQFLLYEDPQRPTATPSDADLHRRLSFDGPPPQPDLYTFGDETRLILRQDLNDGTISNNDPKDPLIVNNVENEALNTAWRYPVDTNNDGKFDTFTLYGIYFRTPNRNGNGEFTRARKPLDARTPPTSVKSFNPNCIQGGGTIASLVGDSGWYKLDGKLKKSFFVYTVNVPIKMADLPTLSPKETAGGKTYQEFTGTTSISALEYQQDQSRIPLSNNAVVYEDDLDISPGPTLNLNGRIFTNSNLLVTNLTGADRTRLYQVSSPDSCFYEQENSKIIVAGNVVNGWSGSNDATQRNAVGVHLFKQFAPGASGRNAAMLSAARTISTAAQDESASDTSLDVLYNNEGYTDRLSLLVAAQMGPPIPPDNLPDPNTQPSDPFLVRRRPSTQTREQALREYFKQMLRKVPFAEVGLKQNATGIYGLPWAGGANTTLPITGTQDELRPVENSWMIPDETTKIELRSGKLETTAPTGGSPPAEEAFLGDRVVAGNNLPALRWDVTRGKFVSTEDTLPGKWNPSAGGNTRTRSPQVTKLADVGATERSGFWEGAAAETPQNPLAGVGGLRVITSAGVYERINSFLPPPTWIDPSTGGTLRNAATDTYDDPATPGANVEAYPVVWPDTMPMSPVLGAQRVYNNGASDSVVAAANAWDTDALPANAAGLPPKENPAWGTTIDGSTPKYAKGDLRMRATAVYHYAEGGGYDATVKPPNYNSVRPFACVSSYYDPSTAQTARNITPLPNVSGLLAAAGLPANVTQSAIIGSNNGVVYGPPADRTTDAQAIPGADGLLGGAAPNDLQRQANYVFPDGRFANGPLREALLKAPADRKLADKAAIDSTVCALQILANPGGNAGVSGLTDGAIQEVAFLNAREIKAIDRDDPATANVNEAFTLSSPLTVSALAQPAQLTGNYNLPLEEREPLEVRATQIDLNALRGVGGITGGEYLLPNSGIIYASRDDALPDRSARIAGPGGIDQGRSATLSPTDSLLDPTRKPNGILLVNGTQLARNPGSSATVSDVVREKGLTLASNLPVYIQGNFNLHTKQEFEGTFSWDTFYDRTNLDENFACRPNDPRLGGKCTTGDDWRPANVVADSVTLLSQNYRFGFRNEGDFDLRNNAGAAAVLPRRQQGFFNNNFVTNGLSSGAFSDNGLLFGTPGASGTALTDAINYATAPTPALLTSSYFNNFVTPVQRRGPFPEYVMEVCPKIPASACGDNDWFVNPAGGQRAAIGTYTSPDPTDPTASIFHAGSTVDPPMPALQRFPRRVAFDRTDPTFASDPQPLGISGGSGGNIARSTATVRGNNALWFAEKIAGGGAGYDATTLIPYPVNTSATSAGGTTDTDGSRVPLPTLVTASTTPTLPVTGAYTYNGSQPLLVPVPQIMCVTPATPGDPRCGGTGVQNTGWVSQAVATTFNLIIAAGDTPSRALNAAWGDFNGGLQNLPRFLEIWGNDLGTPLSTNILGSFIQQNRSAFSTAPYLPILPLPPANNFPPNPGDRLSSLFDLSPTAITNIQSLTTYNIAGARIPYFTPPTRNWGFDVGLLSQPPDLFTQKFTTPPSRPSPDEYFREVPRNDEWVTTLMCSKVAANNQNATSSRQNCPPS
jgi:type II secretory pathway pseudopilin PulG